MSDINLSDYSKYIIKNINPQCHEYYPTCVHDITIILNNNIQFNIFMKGDEIANYYNYHQIDIPYHFNNYISERGFHN
jgi:hypothetical protein